MASYSWKHTVNTTAYNVPKPMYGSELLMMGRKAARNLGVVMPIELEFSASVGFIYFNLLRCTVIRTQKPCSNS